MRIVCVHNMLRFEWCAHIHAAAHQMRSAEQHVLKIYAHTCEHTCESAIELRAGTYNIMIISSSSIITITRRPIG